MEVQFVSRSDLPDGMDIEILIDPVTGAVLGILAHKSYRYKIKTTASRKPKPKYRAEKTAERPPQKVEPSKVTVEEVTPEDSKKPRAEKKKTKEEEEEEAERLRKLAKELNVDAHPRNQETLSESLGLNSLSQDAKALSNFLAAEGSDVVTRMAEENRARKLRTAKERQMVQVPPKAREVQPKKATRSGKSTGGRTTVPVLACAFCGTEAEDVKRMKKCSGCEGHYLCNAICQREDLNLNKHNLVCPGYQ